MKIALVSLDQIWEDKIKNQELCIKYVSLAKEFGPELIVFPEMTLTGFSMNTKSIAEEKRISSSLIFFSQLSKDFNLPIAFGVVFRTGSKATNNLVITDFHGNIISSYAKIHPFSFSGENIYYEGGDMLVLCTLDKALIGSTICYDLRFPEIFQSLSKTCNIILNIANWPERRIDHWDTLLKARAIENQVFMVGVNRTGIDGNNLRYVSSSSVYDPLGLKMNPIHTVLNLDIYDIQLDSVNDIRKSFPVKQDRKVDLYKLTI